MWFPPSSRCAAVSKKFVAVKVARARAQLGELTPEQEEVLEALTQGLVNKILHTPFATLKRAALPDRSRFLGFVRAVFHLEDEPLDAPLPVE